MSGATVDAAFCPKGHSRKTRIETSPGTLMMLIDPSPKGHSRKTRIETARPRDRGMITYESQRPFQKNKD